MPTHYTHTKISLDPDEPLVATSHVVHAEEVALRLLPDVLNIYGTRRQLVDLLRAGLTALYADYPTEPAIPDTEPEPAPVTPLPVPGWRFGPLGMEEVPRSLVDALQESIDQARATRRRAAHTVRPYFDGPADAS